MITNQVIERCLGELSQLTKVAFAVYEVSGERVMATDPSVQLSENVLSSFVQSPADSQIIGDCHLLKVLDDGDVSYVLVAKGSGAETYTLGRVAVSELQNLIVAYKEKLDKNVFFQNLLLDNLLLVDIYNQAKKLHIVEEAQRCVYILEMRTDMIEEGAEMLRGLYSSHFGDYVTSVDAGTLILVKSLSSDNITEEMGKVASTIADMMNTEAMVDVRVAYGTAVGNLKDVSLSYKEAKMALEVGRIFYEEKKTVSYAALGIGRLIYQLPVNLCRIFVKEVFGEGTISELDDETLHTVRRFLENNQNVSETSRQLYIHRNTLVNRIERLQKITGLDIRVFDDAMTLQIALMVVNYMKYLEKTGE